MQLVAVTKQPLFLHVELAVVVSDCLVLRIVTALAVGCALVVVAQANGVEAKSGGVLDEKSAVRRLCACEEQQQPSSACASPGGGGDGGAEVAASSLVVLEVVGSGRGRGLDERAVDGAHLRDWWDTVRRAGRRWRCAPFRPRIEHGHVLRHSVRRDPLRSRRR